MQLELEKEIKEKLANWKAIIEKYQTPSTKKAIIQIINTFVPYLGLWVLMYFSMNWSIWITLLLAVVNAFFLVRIFIIQHDCGHQSFFKSQRWNNIIGFVCSLFSSLPYKYWAKIHNHHHGHTGQLEQRDIGDIDFLTVREYKNRSWFGRLKYRIFRMPIVLFFFAPFFYFTVSNRYPFMKFKGMMMRIKWSQVRNNIILFALYTGIALLIGWKKFLFIQLTIIFLFAIIAFWFFYVQHQHEEAYNQWRKNWDFLVASIRGATYYKLPKMFQWLTGNIGIHHIHHLSARIPNYNLEKCMKENPILTKYANVLTFKESLKCMSYKLWDEQRQKMISWKEFYRLEKMKLSY
ncbi:MAG: fatty acid desaturase [Saprospiraceae bacterium]|nr:fatty acid desaturase [Bacteroidia bacterium]MBT8229329.1 fatty acid desaturase [Bacteroidia bacterium]NNF21879.1 fatty acid desaturase [Saprospiraceae bacterium]NNK90744.1 fatty acid desaturase [Saprospiraceae bacterium]